MEDVPDSTKVYRPAYVRLRNGSLERVQIRYRGDNPLNWIFDKKSIRLKFRKSVCATHSFFQFLSAQTFTVRRINILRARHLMGLPAPRARPVGYINDSSHGIHIETEHLDESFVRNRILCRLIYTKENSLMPIWSPEPNAIFLKIPLFGRKSRHITGCLKTTAPTFINYLIPCGRARMSPRYFLD